jgi:hypothetical protein
VILRNSISTIYVGIIVHMIIIESSLIEEPAKKKPQEKIIIYTPIIIYIINVIHPAKIAINKEQ